MRIFYTAFANDEVYRAIRAVAPSGIELPTLPADTPQERLRCAQSCDIMVAATSWLSEAEIAAAPRLRLVIHQGVGYEDSVDLAALKARGVRFAITPDGIAEAVAEHAIMLMLMVYRHAALCDRNIRQGTFDRQTFRLRSRNLQGRRVGFVGMGRIAQETARRLQAFDVAMSYTNLSGPLSPEREPPPGIGWMPLPDLVRNSEVLSLHLPLSDQTRGMIDAATLRQMPPGAILINTARGGLVDENALCEAIRSGHLLGAGLDAFMEEPLPKSHPLCMLPTVVLTPHNAVGTFDTFQKRMAAIFDNIAQFRDSGTLRDEIVL